MTTPKFIQTGMKELDEVLQGGLPVGTITTIMAEAGVGITTTAIKIAGNTLAENKNARVYHLDLEQGCSREFIERYSTLSSNYKLVNQGISSIFIKMLIEQDITFKQHNNINDPTIIIVDSINYLTSTEDEEFVDLLKSIQDIDLTEHNINVLFLYHIARTIPVHFNDTIKRDPIPESHKRIPFISSTILKLDIKDVVNREVTVVKTQTRSEVTNNTCVIQL